MVSILGEFSYSFPKPIPLKLKLKNLLEDEVDEKYYLSDRQIKDIQSWNAYEKPLENMEKIDKTNISPTLTTRSGAYAAGMILIKNTENYIEWEDGKNIKMNCRAWKDDKVIATLNTGGETKILIKNATKKGYLEATDGDGINLSNRMKHQRGNVQKDKIQTLTTSGGNDRGVCIGTYQYSKSDKFMNGKDRLQLGKEVSDTLQTTPKEAICYNNLRIRKLSPRECGRLMNVKDEDIDKLLKNQSNSSAFHLFGDSICTNVLMAIFGELLDINWIEKFKEIEDKFIDK